MFNPLKAIAIGAVGFFTLGASPALALRVVPLHVTTKNVRMAVSNDGKPLRVRIVAFDEDRNEITEGIGAYPSQMLANNNGRSVRVRITPETDIVCATTEPGGVFSSEDNFTVDNGTGIHYRACVQANGKDEAFRGSSLGSRLNDALSQ